MVTLDLVINPVILIVAVIFGGIIGLLINRGKLAKSHSKIAKLEMEMVDAHAEILEIQRAYVNLEHQLGENSIPVISMKKVVGKESSKEKATNSH